MESPLADNPFFFIFIEQFLIVLVAVAQYGKFYIFPVQPYGCFQKFQNPPFFHHPAYKKECGFPFFRVFLKAVSGKVHAGAVHQPFLFPLNAISFENIHVFRILEIYAFRFSQSLAVHGYNHFQKQPFPVKSAPQPGNRSYIGYP